MNKSCGNCGTPIRDGQKFCHKCGTANNRSKGDLVSASADTMSNKTTSSSKEQQKLDNTSPPQGQSAQPQYNDLCTRCQAAVKDGQSRCDKCTEELLNEALDSTEPKKFTGYVGTPLFNTWKTSVLFSLLGLFAGVLMPLLTLLPALIFGIFGYLVAMMVILGLQISYAAKVYPSYFTNKPMLRSSNAISFANFMFGGVIFGCIWNHNLTTRTKGISYIVAIVLYVVPTIIPVVNLLIPL